MYGSSQAQLTGRLAESQYRTGAITTVGRSLLSARPILNEIA